MKKIIYTILILALLYGAWYFLSPLFFDQVVDEDFPTPDSSEIQIPSPQKLSQMSESELDLIREETLEDATKIPDAVMAEKTPSASNPVLLTQGNFQGADSFHKGSGKAQVYTLEDGSDILRLEDFSVTNGPDLHVILSTHPNPQNSKEVNRSGSIDLGRLKGNKGDQNYDIPLDFNSANFQSVVIYCAPFHVIFSTATLQ